jgi:hypothetical protein
MGSQLFKKSHGGIIAMPLAAGIPEDDSSPRRLTGSARSVEALTNPHAAPNGTRAPLFPVERKIVLSAFA